MIGVDPGHDRPIALPSQTVGPFFHFGLAPDATLSALTAGAVEGRRIRLRISVLDGDNQPVPDALVEIYQADAQGRYGTASFPGFGRAATNAEGVATFETIEPGAVEGPDGRAQSPHVNVCLLARGLLRQLYTRIYFADDPAGETDPLLTIVPAERRATLIAVPMPAAGGDRSEWTFTVRLQGEDETVFFDL